MTGPSTDTFNITLEVKKLKPENNIYQFASTAPGTYSVMDIGRFVSDFKVFDKKGAEIPSEKIHVNQYKISSPEKVSRIKYKIAETWDTPVQKNSIYRMAGSSLEKDHALLNAHCLIGYFHGKQDADIKLRLEYPNGWEIGTPLTKDKKGYFQSPDYDFSVDSPILLGRLSKASLDLSGSKIEIFTYSKTDMVKSTDLLSSMETMLKAANEFLVELPVERYVFLFHFEDLNYGAWEHSYSSEYIFKEVPYSPELGQLVTSIAAHEFFHVVTPLNIHSEIIQDFNFVTPTPSEHLWLYEGTTEWASDIMQLRYGSMELEEFLEEVREKLNVDDKLDKSYSLSKISLTSYTPEGHKQYFNIYNRGALFATLLDIKLLELSNGKKGLRELILELAKTYGPEKAFPENELFDIIVSMTYPEIRPFFDSYVKNAEPLPIQEYFEKLGIEYFAEAKTGNVKPNFGFDITLDVDKIVFAELDSAFINKGLKLGDEALFLDDVPFSLSNIENIQKKVQSLKVGDTISITVNRDGKPFEVKNEIKGEEEVYKHLLKPMENPTPQQVALREKWMQNLPIEK